MVAAAASCPAAFSPLIMRLIYGALLPRHATLFVIFFISRTVAPSPPRLGAADMRVFPPCASRCARAAKRVLSMLIERDSGAAWILINHRRSSPSPTSHPRGVKSEGVQKSCQPSPQRRCHTRQSHVLAPPIAAGSEPAAGGQAAIPRTTGAEAGCGQARLQAVAVTAARGARRARRRSNHGRRRRRGETRPARARAAAQ